jgi:integrase/recombinase XerD
MPTRRSALAYFMTNILIERLQGKAPTALDVYARAVRRVVERFGCCPDQLSVEQFQIHFAELIDTRSWSLVKVELCGLQFFFSMPWRCNGLGWSWLNIVRPPVRHVSVLPDVLSLEEVARIVLSTRERRYQTFWWTTYSMSLRLNGVDATCGRKRCFARPGACALG